MPIQVKNILFLYFINKFILCIDYFGYFKFDTSEESMGLTIICISYCG